MNTEVKCSPTTYLRFGHDEHKACLKHCTTVGHVNRTVFSFDKQPQLKATRLQLALIVLSAIYSCLARLRSMSTVRINIEDVANLLAVLACCLWHLSNSYSTVSSTSNTPRAVSCWLGSRPQQSKPPSSSFQWQYSLNSLRRNYTALSQLS
jgi:hypothetical protein